MKKMNAGVGIVLGATAAVLLAGLGVYCLPWGNNDPQSSAGFFILALFFFITALSKAMTIQFGDVKDSAPNLVDCLFQGVNKWIAAGLLISFAVPHPQFTGVLLWLGISGILLYSGLKNICHVLFTLNKTFKVFLEERRAVREQLRIQKEVNVLLEMEEEKIKKNAQAEEALIADLSNFFAESDPHGKI